MDILMVTAELPPFCSVAEAGEAVAALSRALTQLGHHVTVVLPKPSNLEASGLMVARRLTPLKAVSGDSITVYDGQLTAGVSVVLLESPELESRPLPYGDEDGKDYPDNARRFVALAHAAQALARQRDEAGRPFDVVHGFDAPGAAVALVGMPVPSVLTVYDARRQGLAPLKEFEAAGLIQTAEQREQLRLGARGAVLKAGMLATDVLTAASPSYARRLKEEDGEFAALATVLIAADVEISGVLGGIDYAVYNPATDTALPTRYDAEDPRRKGNCKSALCRNLEIDYDPSTPLVAMTGALDKDHGADLVIAALPGLLKQPLNLVVAGAGAKGITKQLGAAKWRRLQNFRFLETSAPAELRRVQAAADITLHPARLAPSGQAPRIAQRLGAIPVASALDGHLDAIVDCDAELQSGTGMLFEPGDPSALEGAVGRALGAYASAGWLRLQRRVMRLDLGWERAARRYAQLYRVAERRG